MLEQLVDDVEFWFPQNKDSIVEYRSASRVGNFDFDVNKRRIKVQFLYYRKNIYFYSVRINFKI